MFIDFASHQFLRLLFVILFTIFAHWHILTKKGNSFKIWYRQIPQIFHFSNGKRKKIQKFPPLKCHIQTLIIIIIKKIMILGGFEPQNLCFRVHSHDHYPKWVGGLEWFFIAIYWRKSGLLSQTRINLVLYVSFLWIFLWIYE